MSEQIQLTETKPTSQEIKQVLADTKPTYQEVEQALINVVKTGIYYRRPKEGKFLQSYKE